MPSLRCFLRALVVACCAYVPASSLHAHARFCASADALQFGNRAVGSSTTAQVRIESCGDEPWTFTDVSRHPSTAPAFDLSTNCAAGVVLAPGEGCTVSVRFAPNAPGQVSGALWLKQTSTTPDQLLTFYGRGVVADSGTAAIRFTPTIADLGDATLGTTTAWLDVELRNVGGETLVPSALVINGPDAYAFATISYGDPGDCAIGRPVAAGQACRLHFRFTPSRAGAHAAQLVVDAPQLAGLVTLPLRGTGEDPAHGTVEAIEFFHAGRNHYFLTTESAEAAMIDAGGVGPGWVRTGERFRVWPAGSDARSNLRDACRFLGTPGLGPAAHFFTADALECERVRADPYWQHEGVAFRTLVPDEGRCAAGFDPVTRLFFSGTRGDAMRHRYVADPDLVAMHASAGWIVEGAVFCTPRAGGAEP